MSLQNKLMSVGQPAAMAQQTAGDVAATAVATGTTQADALPLSCAYNYVTTVNSGTGVRLYGQSARPSSIGDEQTVYNAGANALNVYPPAGEQILGVIANAAFSIPTSSKLTFKKVTNTLWVASETFVQSGIGAVSTDFQTELRSRAINAVTQFGLSTTGTAAANYTALSNALTAASGRALYIPFGNYSIDPSGGILTLGCVLVGDGRNSTILTIAGNGDLFQRSSYSVLQDLSIDMAGATYSGDACKFATSSGYQADRSAKIANLRSGKYALNFAANGGSQFNSFGCNYHTLAAAGVDAAVKVTGTDSGAAPRTFCGTNGDGCTVWDVGACGDFFIYGGFTNSILFSSGSAVNVFISGLRVGSISGTVTIKGSGHQIHGVDFADPVVLDATTSSVTFNCEVPSYNITDSGSGNSVYTGSTSYTPTWTGSVSNPAIGNGSLLGRYSRNGRRVSVDIDVEIGSGTTMGSGTWFFALPKLDESASGVIQVGSGYLKSAGTQHSALALVLPGAQKIQIFSDSVTTVTNSAPGAWANGDFIRVHVDYLVP